jgi:hypothetical protein
VAKASTQTDAESKLFSFKYFYKNLVEIFEDFSKMDIRIRKIVKAERVEKIQMLGSAESLSWSQREDGLQIMTPAQRPCDHAYTFKITLK